MSIRISEENLAAIHRKAEQADMTFTDYVTKACLGKQIVVIDGLDELIRQQKAIGRNLNQLTMLYGESECGKPCGNERAVRRGKRSSDGTAGAKAVVGWQRLIS